MNQIVGRLRHFTPLRYPGGKGRLAPYVKRIMEENDLLDGEYVEPFAGGAAIAMELLFHEYVSSIRINDLSHSVFAFWKSVLDTPEELCSLISSSKLDVEEWARQRSVLKQGASVSTIETAYAFFYLNRTNRSGILNGGIIGGKSQDGPWKMDARFNAPELINRIQAIAALGDRIHLTNVDAAAFLQTGAEKWPSKTLIYCDPPYYVKGRELYYHFYRDDDHVEIASKMAAITKQRWIVSYDNVDPINTMYQSFRRITYDIGYSARSARQGSEVMFFCDGMAMPTVVGAIFETDRRT